MNEIKITLDLRDGVISISDGVINALGKPKQIQIMFNKEERKLAMQACDITDSQAVVIPDKRFLSVEISGRTILKNIKEIMNWGSEPRRVCPGAYISKYRLVCFDLTRARIQ